MKDTDEITRDVIGVATLKEGVRWLVNNHTDSASSASLRETKKEN